MKCPVSPDRHCVQSERAVQARIYLRASRNPAWPPGLNVEMESSANNWSLSTSSPTRFVSCDECPSGTHSSLDPSVSPSLCPSVSPSPSRPTRRDVLQGGAGRVSRGCRCSITSNRARWARMRPRRFGGCCLSARRSDCIRNSSSPRRQARITKPHRISMSSRISATTSA